MPVAVQEHLHAKNANRTSHKRIDPKKTEGKRGWSGNPSSSPIRFHGLAKTWGEGHGARQVPVHRPASKPTFFFLAPGTVARAKFIGVTGIFSIQSGVKVRLLDHKDQPFFSPDAQRKFEAQVPVSSDHAGVAAERVPEQPRFWVSRTHGRDELQDF